MINEEKLEKNKIILSSITTLLPTFDKSYTITVIINESKPMQSKIVEFKGGSNCEISQTFEIDNSVVQIERIAFQMFEKNGIFSSPLYKGEIDAKNQIKDEFSNFLLCYLKNSNNEEVAVVYYNFEFCSENLFQQFERNKNKFKTVNQSYFDFSQGETKVIYSSFLDNLEYIKVVFAWFEEILSWKNYWRTLSYLLFTTLSILWFKYFFLFLPLAIIFFHLLYKNKIENFCLVKNEKNLNKDFFYKGMNLYNYLICYYENIMRRVITGEKEFIEVLYIEFIKLFLFNIIFLFFFRYIPWKFIFLFSLWIIFFNRNPPIHSFYIFAKALITTKLSFILNNNYFVRYYSYISKIIASVFPFYFLIFGEHFIDDGETVLFEDNMNIRQKMGIQSGSKKLVKFELYENERWWMFVGWAKNVMMNEIPLWCKCDNLKEYCDKKMIFPPSSEYQWAGEWKVEKTGNTDDFGWEYSNDFKSLFGKDSKGKYVRRRKWVRYAN